eukprot:CAMPEP_0179409684 /NCGR_PEP_ID=MMETSP0799-20121207/2848_1 /TAXON_ID=46947 /ORGANISM="Geminigera cryophila, Strain CCMP2564" /LENGTH=305 /DNA_ID=CAMNT_0021181409 /DNA_START=53 /DNA_END=970 /DNA_ORIENTATION=-
MRAVNVMQGMVYAASRRYISTCAERRIVLPASLPVLMPRLDRSAPADLRAQIRNTAFTGQTSGAAPGFVQCNFVALPKEYAFDFMTFCLRNPKPCPLIEVLDPGNPEPQNVAPGADVRTDIPQYRVFRNGVFSEDVHDITALWTRDMVGFLLGCSFSWEGLLKQAHCPPRHLQQGCNVPMFVTNRKNEAAGIFQGKLVVSMRPYRPDQFETVTEITSRYPLSHGGPIHYGDPQALGIDTSNANWNMHPDFGDGVPIEKNEVPVFWACGVTPQTAIMEARLPLVITHAPGHMFVTDLLTSEIMQRY